MIQTYHAGAQGSTQTCGRTSWQSDGQSLQRSIGEVCLQQLQETGTGMVQTVFTRVKEQLQGRGPKIGLLDLR